MSEQHKDNIHDGGDETLSELKRKRSDIDSTNTISDTNENNTNTDKDNSENKENNTRYKITNTKSLQIIKDVFKLNNVERDVKTFDCIDPFNKQNVIKGCIVTKHGKYNGSMIIDNINNINLNEPNVVYNIPNLNYLYPKKQKKGTCFLPENYFKNIKNLTSYCFMNKWNGSNIVLYKYRNNDGIEFISCKTKGTPIVENNPKHSILFYDLTVKSLQKLNLFNETILKNSNNIYFNHFINDKNINSLSCELCGFEEPHLVKYDFDIELKPLLFLFNNSKIKPCILETIENKNENNLINNNEEGELNNIKVNKLIEYKSSYKTLIEQVKSLQEYNFNLNENFRKENNLKHAYEYNHFITEGCVLYLLDKENYACDRNFIFKIKPNDIEQVHWENFNEKHEKLVDEALLKIELRNLDLTEFNIKREMDTMGEKEWSKFSSDILKYVHKKKGINLLANRFNNNTTGDDNNTNDDDNGEEENAQEPQKKKVKQ